MEKKLSDMCEKLGVDPEALYNADQTGFLYQKLPNSLYANKEGKRGYMESKLMKDKRDVLLWFALL